MTLSEIRKCLDRRGIQLTKSLGQSFLHDPHALERMANAAELSRADAVLEIGPGLGPLTEQLLKRAGSVVAIEKDARLVKVLEERFQVVRASSLPSDLRRTQDPVEVQPETPGKPHAETGTGGTPVLHLLHADALELLKQEQHDWSDWKMVSNLPYSVASPMLVELCQGARAPRVIVATLQWEVAQRLMSGPGPKDYGVLTLLVQLDYEPRGWFKISAGCFFPEPDVDSACILLRRRAALLLPEHLRPAYVRIVKRAFSQRRKMMFKLLKQDWTPESLEAAFQHAGLSPQIRAEAVSLEQFVKITTRLAGAASGPGRSAAP